MVAYSLENVEWPTHVITWSFAAFNYPNDPLLFSTFNAVNYQALVEQALTKIVAISGLTFQQIPDSPSPTAPAYIRIGFSALNTLTTNHVGLTSYSYADGLFRPDVQVAAEDPAQVPLSTTGPVHYQGYQTTLYQVFLHELLHAVGLGHATDPFAVMYPSLGVANPDANATDIAGIQALYGPNLAFILADRTSHTITSVGGARYAGPVAGLTSEYITLTADNINIAASVANVFLHSGAGQDALQVLSGRNVLDGGTGSNYLTGGSGQDTFFIDDRLPAADLWSTIAQAHGGDNVTVWGLTTAASGQMTWADGQGAAGGTGLTLHVVPPGAPIVSLTLAGFTNADLHNGRLSLSFGTSGGSAYLNIALV